VKKKGISREGKESESENLDCKILIVEILGMVRGGKDTKDTKKKPFFSAGVQSREKDHRRRRKHNETL
jgi:hypothetical protein